MSFHFDRAIPRVSEGLWCFGLLLVDIFESFFNIHYGLSNLCPLSPNDRSWTGGRGIAWPMLWYYWFSYRLIKEFKISVLLLDFPCSIRILAELIFIRDTRLGYNFRYEEF